LGHEAALLEVFVKGHGGLRRPGAGGRYSSASGGIFWGLPKVRHVDGKVRHGSGKVRNVGGKVRHVGGKVRNVGGKVRHGSGKVRNVGGKVRNVGGKVRHVGGKVRHVGRKDRNGGRKARRGPLDVAVNISSHKLGPVEVWNAGAKVGDAAWELGALGGKVRVTGSGRRPRRVSDGVRGASVLRVSESRRGVRLAVACHSRRSVGVDLRARYSP
jgi:hypothetical protein